MNGLLLVLVGDPKGSSLASTASSFQKIKIFQSYLVIENVLLLNLANFDLSIFFYFTEMHCKSSSTLLTIRRFKSRNR